MNTEYYSEGELANVRRVGISHRRMLPLLLTHFGLPLVAVEVGVCGGAFSEELLLAGIEKIYCIDNWGHIHGVTGDGNYPADFHDRNYKEYENRLQEYKDRVVTLKGLSSVMHTHIPDNSLGLFYQDGSHEYKTVKDDLKNYVPKLVSGGIIGLHDYYNESYGVKQAVDEFASQHGLIINEIPEENPLVSSVWMRIL